MKIILLLILASLGMVGCAHSIPKESTVDVFNSIKTRNINHAREVYADDNGSDWVMPSGETLISGDFKILMEQGITYINTCDELLQSVKAAKNKFDAEVVQDEDNAVTEAEEVVSSAEPDFRSKCEFNSQGWDRLSIVRIKKLTTVNLFVDYDGTKKKFDAGLAALKAEIVSHNKGINDREKNHEMSEREDQNTSWYYSKKLCEMQEIINAATSNITEEKEAAKASGFVDKRKMYENGRALQINKENIARFGAEYKKKFGKNWNSTQCK